MAEKKEDELNAKNGNIVISGNVTGSNIFQGDNNIVINRNINLAPLFETIHQAVDNQQQLTDSEKKDIKAELQEVKTALEVQQPDESFIARRFRIIQRMAPDIVEVAMATLKNPIGGVAEIIKKVAKKMAESS